MSINKNTKRIVVKVGTSTLTHKTGALNLRRIEHLVRVLADLKNSGLEVIIVSSGAVGVGVGELALTSRPTDTPTRQACAAIGQCELMYTYDRLFVRYHHKVAQVLLTPDIMEVPLREQNVKNAFSRLLELGVIPIVNENDAVATDEIAYHEDNYTFGDNDALSAMVGSVAEADLLIILSDIDGLYNKDPRSNADAEMLHEVSELTDEIFSFAGDEGSALGRGGMMAKLKAAQIANDSGFPMIIMNGNDPDDLYRLFDGEAIGTLFDFSAKKEDPHDVSEH